LVALAARVLCDKRRQGTATVYDFETEVPSDWIGEEKGRNVRAEREIKKSGLRSRVESMRIPLYISPLQPSMDTSRPGSWIGKQGKVVISIEQEA
jgi:hypothetical protein